MKIKMAHMKRIALMWTQANTDEAKPFDEDVFREDFDANMAVLISLAQHVPEGVTEAQLRAQPSLILPAARAFFLSQVRQSCDTHTDQEILAAAEGGETLEVAEFMLPMMLNVLALIPRLDIADLAIEAETYDWDRAWDELDA